MSNNLTELLNTYNNKKEDENNDETFKSIIDNIINIQRKISDLEDKLLSIESNIEKMSISLNELKKIMID